MAGQSVYDLYEFYLEPRDLKEKAHLVTVANVRVENVINPRARKPEPKIVLSFLNRKKKMILNKTQAGAMVDLTGTDIYSKWIGHEVVLVEDTAGNGRQTIRITTREESGDIDLMFVKPPKPEPKPEPKPVAAVVPEMPAGWWDSLSDEAVNYAAGKWGIGKAEAWAKINNAINDEAISRRQPMGQFVQWVELVK